MQDGVLLLGSNGFIGKHLCARFEQMGLEVFAVSRSETEGEEGRIHRIRGSLEDSELIRGLVTRAGTIVHAANLTTPSASATNPQLEIDGNLGALAQLLALANEFPDRRLVFMSSAGAVYGDLELTTSEDAPLRPRSYYGAGKVAAEAFVHACASTTTWRAVVLRPSNVYGPGQQVGKGFAIVPTLFSRALDDGVFKIWGDGLNVRDYCYVDDLVELTARVVENGIMKPFAVYNAASGQTASVLDLIAACERCTGRRIDIRFESARSVDVPFVSLSTESALAAYGWKAKMTLVEGLNRTWDNFRQAHARNAGFS